MTKEGYEELLKHLGRYVLYDNIFGQTVPVDALMYGVLRHFVIGRFSSIADPTCGVKNRLFSKLVPLLRKLSIDYRPCDKLKNNWACRNGFSNCVCDVFDPSTLPRAQVWVYDPPFTPYDPSLKVSRKEDYGLRDQGLSAIMRYYSRGVFEGFISKGARLIIVKGSDFYYPKDSDNLYVFIKDIIDPAPSMKLVALIKYRYFVFNTPLQNYLLWRMVKRRGLFRVHNVTSYFAVYKVH